MSRPRFHCSGLTFKFKGTRSLVLTQPCLMVLCDVCAVSFLSIGKGFVTDGASVPRFFWRVLGNPLQGHYRQAALLHDALYAVQTLSRAQSDRLFYRAMCSEKTAFLIRLALYVGVRLFGGTAWKSKSRQFIAASRRRIKVYVQSVRAFDA